MSDIHPIENPATAQWGRPITHSGYLKILKGFSPRDMDDRWVIVTDTPDAQGNTVVHACRSWTSREQFRWTISAGNPHDTEAKNWGTIVEIIWEKIRGIEEVTEEEAKEFSVGFCKGLMECEMGN